MREYKLELGGGRLIQVANPSLSQMMCYVIDTPNGGVILIDSGNYDEENAQNLRRILAERNNRVDLWFITHAHDDHHGALTYLMEHTDVSVQIGCLLLNFPPNEWLASREDNTTNEIFLEQLRKRHIRTKTVSAGDVFLCDGVRVKVLSAPEDYQDYPNINSTSLILKVCFPKREVLFLGDFDEFAQKEYLSKHGAEELRCDVVQMAHHGQAGVDRAFYSLILPKYCLYTAPVWLWENNFFMQTDTATAGKGPFTIMETRRWMDELGAVESFTFEDGDVIFS